MSVYHCVKWCSSWYNSIKFGIQSHLPVTKHFFQNFHEAELTKHNKVGTYRNMCPPVHKIFLEFLKNSLRKD